MTETFRKEYILGFLLTFLIVCFAIFKAKLLLLIFLPFVLLVVFKSIVNREFVFYFISGILFLLPQLDRYGILPAITKEISLSLLTIVFFFNILYLPLKYSYTKFFLILFTYLTIQLGRGIIYGYPSNFIISESIRYLFYPFGYFFVLSLFVSERDVEKKINRILNIFQVFGAIVVIEMLVYYFISTHGDRVLTRQANLLLLTLMISLSKLFFCLDLKLKDKIIQIVLSVSYIVGILLFMQRSLWLGAIASIITFLAILCYKKKYSIQRIIKVTISLFLILVVIITMWLNFTINKDAIEKRADVVEKGGKTFSVAARLLSYINVYSKIKENWFFGKGIGDSITTPYLNQRTIEIVDNSYIVVLWKMGIIGFFFFVILFFKNFKQGITIILNTDNYTYLIFSIVTLTTFMGQFVNGLACVVLTLYYFNFIWATLISITDVVYLQIKKNHDE